MLRFNQPSTSAQLKRSLTRSAIADIDYVLRNAPEDFVLRNEILARKARILIVAGSPDAAFEIAEQVAAKWPEQADSHGLVAEALLALGRRSDAKKVLDAATSSVLDKDRLARIRSVLKL
jgi:thioredoxin-like negative regulator of GroEL